jgi:hypothetical protein
VLEKPAHLLLKIQPHPLRKLFLVHQHRILDQVLHAAVGRRRHLPLKRQLEIPKLPQRQQVLAQNRPRNGLQTPILHCPRVARHRRPALHRLAVEQQLPARFAFRIRQAVRRRNLSCGPQRGCGKKQKPPAGGRQS